MALSCTKKTTSIIKGFFTVIRRNITVIPDSFRTKSKLESHEKVCESKDFCNVIMPSEETKILEINQYQKSDKAPVL